ncbi:putative transcription factor GAGA-Binding-like family [Helianthus annuus]|nr:putative transcription factor GAGA-Binding-like family [Helianthus annuus]KAJ0866062.1 putative transcription factor GAGA-Binding-like family [Helianthus annuus]
MDDDGLNMRNWGYYEPPSFKEHLGLQLMSPMVDHRDPKPFLSARENPIMLNPNVSTYHHPHTRVVSEPPGPMNYMRDGWIQRERLLHMSHPIHMVPPLDMCKDPVLNNNNMSVEDNVVVSKDIGGSGDGDGGGDCGGISGGNDGGSVKKRGSTTATPKSSRSKKQKKNPSTPKDRAKTIKKGVDVVINGIDMDISGIPIPVCTCTGSPQQCYRWGFGGWQSACCTTTISMYPLPMSTKRRGARIAGRKMSQGAFKKVLEKLASEGYNFANAIDLRTYWAKHGTNKFVTIR